MGKSASPLMALSSFSTTGSLGTLSSKEATTLLEGQPPGTWLLRYSENQKQTVVSVVKSDGNVGHLLMQNRPITPQLIEEKGLTLAGQILPKNQIKESTPMSDLEQLSHGRMDSRAADQLLRPTPEGSWLLRYSGNQESNCLSVKEEGNIAHYPIRGDAAAAVEKLGLNWGLLVIPEK